MAPAYEQTIAGYRNLWNSAKVLPSRQAAVEAIARKLLDNRARYEAIEKATGVPWFMVGAIHNREASMSFAGVLHNGEHIIGTGKKTKLVPAGRGPFATWEAAAIDALTKPPHSLNKVPAWPVERILYETEKYNGWGYLGKCNSPYLWSFTTQYSGGKYIADHVFSKTAMDQQAGCVAILKALAELDSQVAARLAGTAKDKPKPAPLPQPPPAPKTAPAPVSAKNVAAGTIAAGGAVGGVVAHSAGASTSTIAAIVVIAVAVAALVWVFMHRKTG